ncbi:MAG: hypothetical protein ACO1TE_20430 [Prosthecobacter sp.]
MKAIILSFSLLGAASLLAQTASPPPVTSATLDESEVRITYGELKRLVAATLPKETPPAPKPAPPVPAALLSSMCLLDAKAGVITASLEVESFAEGWQPIPLAGACSGAASVEPKTARLIIHEEHLCLIMDKPGVQSVKLTFPLNVEGQGTTLFLAPSPVAMLAVKDLPEGKVLRVQRDATVQTLAAAGSLALPAGGGEVSLRIEDAKTAQAQPLGATDDAIISTATYTTQVVRDGSVLTEGAITVRHDHPVKLTLQLPEAAKLLQCHVNGEPVRPAPGTAGRVEIPLDDPATDGAESEVRLSFTAATTPLQAAEGELELALPQTPLFARQIDWNVQLPATYDLAFSGNVDAITDKTSAAAPGLHLRKSLSRDQQPQARIIYRKRTSN